MLFVRYFIKLYLNSWCVSLEKDIKFNWKWGTYNTLLENFEVLTLLEGKPTLRKQPHKAG